MNGLTPHGYRHSDWCSTTECDEDCHSELPEVLAPSCKTSAAFIIARRVRYDRNPQTPGAAQLELTVWDDELDANAVTVLNAADRDALIDLLQSFDLPPASKPTPWPQGPG